MLGSARRRRTGWAPVSVAGAIALLWGCRGDRGDADEVSAEEHQRTAAKKLVDDPPNFARDVAPILYKHCTSCHHEGGPAPFSFVEYESAKAHASQITEVTLTEYMPPWLPAEGFGAFEGEQRLMHAEKKTLAGWAAAGKPPGNLADAPKPPVYVHGWQLGAPDLELEADAAFDVPADGKDVYRNFVIHVPPGPPRFVKTVELQPGPPQVVHHAVVRVDASGDARRLDSADADPGFDGMVFAGATMPGGRFIGWTPGRVPHAGSDDRSWQLVGDSDLVVQVHLRPTGKPEKVRPKLGIHFAAHPPTKVALAMELSSTEIDIPAGEANYRVEDTFTLPADVNVISVYPHAHYLGTDLEGFATLPNGNKRWLIKITRWDFNWQDEYRFMKPVALPKGSVITMNYRYDNSADNPRNPASPPVRVQFGPDSADEMAELILEIEPADPAELPKLDAAFRKKWLSGQVETVRRQIKADDKNAQHHANLAALLLRAGDTAGAKASYEASLALRDHADTHLDLAVLFLGEKNWVDASAQIDAALVLEPESARGHLTQGNVRRLSEVWADAVVSYQRALELDPSLVNAHNNLGVSLEKLEKPAEAAAAFESAIELAPGRAKIRENHGRALQAAGAYTDAIAAYRAALERNPGSLRAMQGLAWLLATHPDEKVRDPAEALVVAQGGADATQGRSPEVLEALAAAMAASGMFAEAKPVIERAITLGEAAKRDDLVARYREHLALFELKKPIVLPAKSRRRR